MNKSLSEKEEITFDEWKLKVHTIYIDDPEKSNTFLIKHFSILSEKDHENIRDMIRRLDEIFTLGQKIKVKMYQLFFKNFKSQGF